MSDLLAIIDASDTDEELVSEIIRRHGDRVILLLEDASPDWAGDDTPKGRALRDRLTALRAAIEARSGAVVIGLVNSRDQLLGWRFDRIVGGHTARTSAPAI
jgi:hypothetical protein